MITPKLALDFTSGVLDPSITFSRAGTTATRINSSGYIEGVAADTARFDFDPVTLVCKGLLIEESKQNLLTYSNDFSFVSYGKTNLTISTVAETAPDGAATVTKLTYTTTSGQITRSVSSFSTNTAYTLSLYVKSAGQFTSTLRLYTVETGFATNAFDLSAVTASSGTITPAGNGWFRITTSFTTGATITNAQVQLCRNAAATGDAFYIFGVQLEEGLTATSYVPNVASALTRNADVAVITGTDFSDWWQAGRGGVSVNAIPSTVSGTRPLIQFDDNTADNLIALQGNTTNPELYIVDSTTPQAQIDAGTIAAGTPYTLTGWWQTDFCAARKDNGAKVIDNSATIPTVTQARLGSDGTNYLNGHLATINYYDRFSGQIYTRRKNKAVFSVL